MIQPQQITIKTNIVPEQNQLWNLFCALDWHPGRTLETAKTAFDNSSYVVTAWENESFAIAGLESTEPYHAECMAFRDRMEKESVLCVVSDFVYNELAFQRIKIPLMAEARRTGRSWLEVKRSQPHLIALAMSDVDTKKSELDQFALNGNFGYFYKAW